MENMEMIDTIKRRYRGGRDRLFILHGNTGDLFPIREDDGSEQLLTLPDYLYRALTDDPKKPDSRVWMHYALGFETRWMNATVSRGSERIAKLLGADGENRVSFARKPLDFFRLLEQVSTRREKPAEGDGEGKIIPLRSIVTEAHMIIPNSQTAFMRPEDRELLVLLRRFATEPRYDATDTLIVLVTDALSGIHSELREVAVTIEIPRPDEKIMVGYLDGAVLRAKVGIQAEDRPRIHRLAVGLTRRQVENVVAETAAAKESLNAGFLSKRRKELIGRDYGEFLEFFTPTWSLDHVGASHLAVERLRELALLLKEGSRQIPSGIIFVGQNGIGKTFLAKALLGSAGITGVELRPFKDSELGKSERNWEKVETALKSAGQIGIMVDEAQSQMGRTSGRNVHEVSKILFSAQMKLMGDPVYRGKIFWILMTSRPDLLSPDVKRPGRADLVIPLFPVLDEQGASEILQAQITLLARDDGYQFSDEFVSGAFKENKDLLKALVGKTGGQICDKVLRRAKARHAKKEAIRIEHVMNVLKTTGQFAIEPEAYELQRLLGIAEAIETENTDLVPECYQAQVTEKYRDVNGMKIRIDELRAHVDDL